MESVYWVLCWACHRRCRHCYDDRFRPYVRADLERVTAEAESAFPAIVANLPARLDRIVLAGGEVLVDPVYARVLLPVMDALRDRYGTALKIIIQTTGDLLTGTIVRQLLDHGAWMISAAGLDDFHVGHEGEARQQALRARLSALFAAHGMRPSGHAAPVRGWAQEDGPVFSMFGATADMWIGKLWPRGRAQANGLSTATMDDNFCAEWSGGRGFLDGSAGGEVSVEPDGSVYPCCIKTGVPIGSLAEERLEDILDRLRGHAAFQAINRGDPTAMAEAVGIDRAAFAGRCTTAGAVNFCIGCASVHAEKMAPLLADLRQPRTVVPLLS